MVGRNARQLVEVLKVRLRLAGRLE